jgi:hypothetical protein
MLFYRSEDLTPTSYKDYDFELDCDSRRFTSRYVFTLGGKAINWRSVMSRNLDMTVKEAILLFCLKKILNGSWCYEDRAVAYYIVL